MHNFITFRSREIAFAQVKPVLQAEEICFCSSKNTFAYVGNSTSTRDEAF